MKHIFCLRLFILPLYACALPSPSFLVKRLCSCTTSPDVQVPKELPVLPRWLFCVPSAGGCWLGCVMGPLSEPALSSLTPPPKGPRTGLGGKGSPPRSLQSSSRSQCCPSFFPSRRSSLCHHRLSQCPPPQSCSGPTATSPGPCSPMINPPCKGTPQCGKGETRVNARGEILRAHKGGTACISHEKSRPGRHFHSLDTLLQVRHQQCFCSFPLCWYIENNNRNRLR